MLLLFEMPSPDGSGILLRQQRSGGRKRYSGQQEHALKTRQR